MFRELPRRPTIMRQELFRHGGDPDDIPNLFEMVDNSHRSVYLNNFPTIIYFGKILRDAAA